MNVFIDLEKARYICSNGGHKLGDFGLFEPAAEKLVAIDNLKMEG